METNPDEIKKIKNNRKAIWLIYFTDFKQFSYNEVWGFFLGIFPTQKYKLVYFRYIQLSYEIMELE